MAILDNAVWLTGAGGSAESGTAVISENGGTTTVTGTFTANAWDDSQSGFNVSEFGAFEVSSPISANYQFSNPVDDLSFVLQHVNSDATHDDMFIIYAYDENGVLLDAADVISGLSGVSDDLVYTNPDGSVTVEAEGSISNNVTVSLPGSISELEVIYQNGPDATISGGAGIGDLSFTVPPLDTDGDGIADVTDLDDDNDGILDTDEGQVQTSPSTITVTFDGDEFAASDNTRWELRDPDGNLIASDLTTDSTVEITDTSITQTGDYTFTVLDDYGDGLGGADPASYTISIDGVVVLDSGANPNFGTSVTETFSVNSITTSTDTDGDGIADHLDLDSDNDGITDNVEAQATADYTAPTGLDSDNDGLDDAYEGAGDAGLTPVDTDNDGVADVIDTDSDNDGIADVDEAGHGVDQATIDASADTDGDGIADVVDDVIGRDVNDADVNGAGEFALADTDNDTALDGSNAIPLVRDLDFREVVPCFTPGALITTKSGEVLVENLRPGDLVLTVDNGYQPVRWVCKRTLTQVDLATHENLRPIVIRKNAFGNRRKMLVSPQHGLIVERDGQETLMRAKHAAETLGGKYARIDKHCERVTYIHLLFDQHEIIYAEGAKTESFFPGPVALKSMDRPVLDELLSLFPDLSTVAFDGECPQSRYGSHARRYLLRKEVRKMHSSFFPVQHA